MRTEFRISGSGGQGVITAGIMLANAAVRSGIYAVQSQSYGPEARGGSSKAEVVISDVEIDYPKAVSPQYALCLTKESYIAYGKTAPEGTKVYVDSSIEVGEDSRAVSVPIMNVAKEISLRSANVVAVAFLAGLTGLISKENLQAALKEQFPRFYETNLKCAEAGYEMAENLQ
ncbi:MAG: 2-oxoacid:acceptor oxidoreductase family protein [Defluviitaleaceae bacterium]|nr:2-oxoacid:acceptor oxidoreductase family protein [Defluviitaleaceae bacterium]